MESILQNLNGMAELLAVARSEYVSHWDPETVQRAFQWATYFEHLHGRFRTNTRVHKALADRLLSINESLRNTFGLYRELSFKDVGHCRGVLLASLLSNPALPKTLSDTLFARFRPCCFDTTGQRDQSDLNHLIGIARLKAASKVLSHALKLDGSTATKPYLLLLDPETETKGEMVLKSLETWMRCPSAGPRDKLVDILFAQLQQDKINNRSDFSKIVAAVLLAKQTSTESGAVDLALKWLLSNRCQLQTFCLGVPCALLSELAHRYPSFRCAYLELLTKWARSMEYDFSCGDWRHGSSPELNWKELVDRFMYLLEGPTLVKEATETALCALKADDGDFEVWGISVWTDLLIALKKM
ncbi:Fanconi anemia group F protein [Huso huso]|uniref:Fanconi anemia group F protein n=1 Tax=Huso huso TaxID=61971 RepID=A0ABR0YK00_HUSHU